MLKQTSEKTFKLIKKYFPRNHRLYKIFNKNTLKLSCSCKSNMFRIIKQHNCKVLPKKCRLVM